MADLVGVSLGKPDTSVRAGTLSEQFRIGIRGGHRILSQDGARGADERDLVAVKLRHPESVVRSGRQALISTREARKLRDRTVRCDATQLQRICLPEPYVAVW